MMIFHSYVSLPEGNIKTGFEQRKRWFKRQKRWFKRQNGGLTKKKLVDWYYIDKHCDLFNGTTETLTIQQWYIALYWWSKPRAWKLWHIFGGVCGLTWNRKSAANKATRIGTSKNHGIRKAKNGSTSCGTDSNKIVSGYGTECQLVVQQISMVEGYWCYPLVN